MADYNSIHEPDKELTFAYTQNTILYILHAQNKTKQLKTKKEVFKSDINWLSEQNVLQTTTITTTIITATKTIAANEWERIKNEGKGQGNQQAANEWEYHQMVEINRYVQTDMHKINFAHRFKMAWNCVHVSDFFSSSPLNVHRIQCTRFVLTFNVLCERNFTIAI